MWKCPKENLRLKQRSGLNRNKTKRSANPKPPNHWQRKVRVSSQMLRSMVDSDNCEPCAQESWSDSWQPTVWRMQTGGCEPKGWASDRTVALCPEGQSEGGDYKQATLKEPDPGEARDTGVTGSVKIPFHLFWEVLLAIHRPYIIWFPKSRTLQAASECLPWLVRVTVKVYGWLALQHLKDRNNHLCVVS